MKGLCRLFFSVMGCGRVKRVFHEMSRFPCWNATTKSEAQRSIRTFYEAVKVSLLQGEITGSDMTVVIVMPTYNEAACIGDMIRVLLERVFPEITRAKMHLLIVDDDSPDRTGDVVRAMALRDPCLHLLTGTRRGLGWAYVRGMKYAMEVLHADAVMEMDADFQHDPACVPRMVERLLAGADYVIGSRYTVGGSVPASWLRYRKFLSFWGNRAFRCLLNERRIHDYTTGLRLTRVKGVLDQIVLENVTALELSLIHI